MLARGRNAEVVVEGDYAMYFGTRQIQFFGNHRHRIRRDIAQAVLDIVQDRSQCAWTLPLRLNYSDDGFFLPHLLWHLLFLPLALSSLLGLHMHYHAYEVHQSMLFAPKQASTRFLSSKYEFLRRWRKSRFGPHGHLPVKMASGSIRSCSGC
jgi:hypothetical protein